MRGKLPRSILVLAVLVTSAKGIAMSEPGQEQQHHCHVTGSEKLPTATGGASAICAALEGAVAARVPDVRFSAEVRVLSPSMLATALVVNGRVLPEQKFAVMDGKLGESSIKRFANSIAEEVAKAAKS